MMSTHKEITIHYHPQDGAKWAKYLQSKLGEREYQIDIALNDVTSDDISQGKRKINVFLITPDFLELIDLNIMKGFDHQYSLAILMGVDTENFTFMTIQHGVHEYIKDWVMLDVDESEESVRHLLMTIVTMYEYDYPAPRIRLVFRDVIDEGLKIFIGLEKKAESDVSVQFDGKDEVKATHTNRYFYTFSLTDEEAQMFSTFNVTCKKHKIGEGHLKDLVPSPQKVNPTEGSLTAEHASGAVGGRQPKLQQLWELLEEETDPINLLSQCMGLRASDREQLDRQLANKISASGFPEHICLMGNHEDSLQTQSDQRWPTLLHFAAEYNLVVFAEAQLSYPALEVACQIRNRDGRTPDEIANHSDIRRWSNDSGYGDKVRLSQIKAYVEKGESSESSQMCPPPPAPHVGYVRPPKPRPVHVVQVPSLGEKDGELDRRAADDISATRDVKGEQTEENVRRYKLEDSGETMSELENDKETHTELQTDPGAADEIVFLGHPDPEVEEFQQPPLIVERNAVAENRSYHQQINIREMLEPEAKKKGFFFKLFKRRDKSIKRASTKSSSPPVEEF